MAKKKRKKTRRPKLTPVLQWMRAKKDETTLAHRSTWESRCRQYKVQKSVGKLAGMDTIYYALQFDRHWTIIGRKRTRNAAEQACEYDNATRSRKVVV